MRSARILLLTATLLVARVALAQSTTSSAGVTCGVCSPDEESNYCQCPAEALSVCTGGAAAGGCGAAGTWETSPSCTSCCVCSGTTTAAPTSYSTTATSYTTTSNGNEITTPAPTSYTTTATSYTTTSNGNEITTPAPTSYSTTATSYTTTSSGNEYTTTSNGNEITTPAPTSYTSTPTSYTSRAPTTTTWPHQSTTTQYPTTTAYTTSNGNEITTAVPPTTTAYQTTAAPPCHCVTVSAILVLGGNGWLKIQVNVPVWEALLDALRADLAYALGCAVGNVTVTDCSSSSNGLTVSYDVKTNTAADAYSVSTKAQSLSSSALRATMLLYQSAAPSGTNVTIGWATASYDGSFGDISGTAGLSNIMLGLSATWVAILMLMRLP